MESSSPNSLLWFLFVYGVVFFLRYKNPVTVLGMDRICYYRKARFKLLKSHWAVRWVYQRVWKKLWSCSFCLGAWVSYLSSTGVFGLVPRWGQVHPVCDIFIGGVGAFILDCLTDHLKPDA